MGAGAARTAAATPLRRRRATALKVRGLKQLRRRVVKERGAERAAALRRPEATGGVAARLAEEGVEDTGREGRGSAVRRRRLRGRQPPAAARVGRRRERGGPVIEGGRELGEPPSLRRLRRLGLQRSRHGMPAARRAI